MGSLFEGSFWIIAAILLGILRDFRDFCGFWGDEGLVYLSAVRGGKIPLSLVNIHLSGALLIDRWLVIDSYRSFN